MLVWSLFAPRQLGRDGGTRCGPSPGRPPTEQFKKAIDNLGDVVAYLDKPEFAKFWDEDAKRVEARSGDRQGVRMTARQDDERSVRAMVRRRDHWPAAVHRCTVALVFAMSGDLPFGTLASPAPACCQARARADDGVRRDIVARADESRRSTGSPGETFAMPRPWLPWRLSPSRSTPGSDLSQRHAAAVSCCCFSSNAAVSGAPGGEHRRRRASYLLFQHVVEVAAARHARSGTSPVKRPSTA